MLIGVGLIVVLVGAFGWGLAVFTIALLLVPAAWGVRYRRRLRHEAAVNSARARERHEQFLSRYAKWWGLLTAGMLAGLAILFTVLALIHHRG